MAVAGAAKRARILVSGASGMVGTALIDSLRKPSTGLTPHTSRLVRHDPRGPDEVFWDPYEMRIDIDRVEGFDAVVHLAGEPMLPGDVADGECRRCGPAERVPDPRPRLPPRSPAGENIGDGDSTLGGLVGRWSDRKRHRIMESRRRGELESPDRPQGRRGVPDANCRAVINMQYCTGAPSRPARLESQAPSSCPRPWRR